LPDEANRHKTTIVETEGRELKAIASMTTKAIGTASATAVGLGAIIGAGIFTLSGTAIALAGIWSLFSFVLVGFVAIVVALEIGELCSIFPAAKGASYSYVFEAFGSELGFITGVLLYFSYASSISVVALGFGAYLSTLLGLSPDAYEALFAIVVIAVLSAFNLQGIKKAAQADFGLVVIKIAVLIIFIAFAAIFSLRSNASFNISSAATPSNGYSAIFSASVVIFFAYSGFQTISTFASDVKGGARSAAIAIFAAVAISMVLYVLVDLALMLLVPTSGFAVNANPLSFALTVSHAPAYLTVIVAIGALIATASATLAMILSSSRILYQISMDGLLPRILRNYDPDRDVAMNGVLVSAAIAVVMLFSGNIYVMAAISNFGLLFSYLMTGFALIHFRRDGRQGSFRVRMYPYLPLVAILVLLSFMLGLPNEALVVGIVMTICLLMAYYFLKEVEEKAPVKVRLFE
jgi:APA family basic amino acid/polyamine antiporter